MNIALIRTMDSQGRIVIPAEIRKQMKLSDGDALELENVGIGAAFTQMPYPLKRKRGNGFLSFRPLQCHPLWYRNLQ